MHRDSSKDGISEIYFVNVINFSARNFLRCGVAGGRGGGIGISEIYFVNVINFSAR